jgi:hypothetical protein
LCVLCVVVLHCRNPLSCYPANIDARQTLVKRYFQKK